MALNFAAQAAKQAAVDALVPDFLPGSQAIERRLLGKAGEGGQPPTGMPTDEELRRAIGHAEGNLTVTGKKTALYWGHTDPGNRRRNMGWCSDQGRGGGDAARADQECLRYVRKWESAIAGPMQEHDLDSKMVWINAFDLANQAHPRHAPRLPERFAYARANGKGKNKVEQIAWARTATFIAADGTNQAGGLLGICRRENRPVSDWECVYQDQKRRTEAIAAVLEQEGAGGAIAFALPAEGRFTQGYHAAHQAIDIAGPVGSPIRAAAAGTVEFAGWGSGYNEGLGNLVEIRHADDTLTRYAHNSELLVKAGQSVRRGEAIARMGNTGNSTGPHLHFEIERGGRLLDPADFYQLPPLRGQIAGQQPLR